MYLQWLTLIEIFEDSGTSPRHFYHAVQDYRGSVD